MGKTFAPLEKAVWTSPDTSYGYNKNDNYGTWRGTQGAKVYAPEAGEIVASEDGRWVLTAVNGGVRVWVGMSPLDTAASKYASKTAVKGGELLGVTKSDLQLALGLIPAGQSAPTWVDPVAALQAPEAAVSFVDFSPSELATTPAGVLATVTPSAGGRPWIGEITPMKAFWGGLIIGTLGCLLVAGRGR